MGGGLREWFLGDDPDVLGRWFLTLCAIGAVIGVLIGIIGG